MGYVYQTAAAPRTSAYRLAARLSATLLTPAAVVSLTMLAYDSNWLNAAQLIFLGTLAVHGALVWAVLADKWPLGNPDDDSWDDPPKT